MPPQIMSPQGVETTSSTVETRDAGTKPSKELSHDAHVPIRLQVGEKRFNALTSTLTRESDFFCRMLADDPPSGRTGGGVDYFIDADPSLFEHVLRYLRRGVLPVFFDISRGGHNHAQYAALLAEARFFGIARLSAWLEEKAYLGAVRVVHKTCDVLEECENPRSDATVEMHPMLTTRKSYVCPRRIHIHMGMPDKCGRDCYKARGDLPIQYEWVPLVKVVAVKKQVIFEPTDKWVPTDKSAEKAPVEKLADKPVEKDPFEEPAGWPAEKGRPQWRPNPKSNGKPVEAKPTSPVSLLDFDD